MIKKWLPIVLVTVLVLILVGIKVYTSHPEFITTFMNKGNSVENSKANSEAKKSQDSEDHVQHKDTSKEEQFPFNRKQDKELAKKYSDKFKIVKKMYYSWDYIHNAQGEYERGRPINGDMERDQFYVDFDKKKNRAKGEQLEDGKVIETTNVLLKGGVGIRQMPKKHIYNKQTLKTLKENHFSSVGDFETHYLGLFNKMITSSEWYVLLYNDYPDWDYKLGTKFGIPVYQIKGEIPTNISESFAGPFTMVISKETGVLLDLKCYGDQNKVIFFITANDIQINKGIADDVFHLDVSGDKEVSNQKFNLSSVNNIGGKKPGGVDTSHD